jgi:hypothetical protein
MLAFATCSKLLADAAEDGGGLNLLEARLGGSAGTRPIVVTVASLVRVPGLKPSELTDAELEVDEDDEDFVLTLVSPVLFIPARMTPDSFVGLILRVLTLLLELLGFELLFSTSITLSFSSFCSAFFKL